jgi:hypothetical protein
MLLLVQSLLLGAGLAISTQLICRSHLSQIAVLYMPKKLKQLKKTL